MTLRRQLAAATEMWPSWSRFLLVSGSFALSLGLVKGLGQQKQMALFVVCVLWPVGVSLNLPHGRLRRGA